MVQSSCRPICPLSEPQLPLYVSPIPDPKTWDIDALNINWTGLTPYAYPPTAILHRVIRKTRQCHCLIILIAPGWPGMPWFWDLVQLSTEIPLQILVSTTQLKHHQQEPSTSQVGPFLKNGAEKFGGFLHSICKQISDFFMYLYQDLNRCPATIDGYGTAIVDTLGPTTQFIANDPDLHRLLSIFHRDRPKSSRNLPKWNLSVALNELT